MKFRKILAAAMAGALVFALGGCGNNSSSSQNSDNSTENNDGKTITIWAWDDNFNVKAANIAKDYYAKENPDVTVNVVSMAQKDIVQTLNTALSSGTYNGLPDIVLIEDYRIQNYITAYPDELRDLSDIVNPDDFMDYKIEVMKDGDKIYGVPFDSGVTALFYRTDYIEAAGYSVDDMQDITWDKYIEIGEAVKEATGKYMLSLDPSDLGQLRMMMQSAGEWYTDENGKVNIKDNEALKEAVKTYKKIIDSGISTQITGWDPFVAAFQKGDVASVPTGCWIAPTIAAADDQSGKWAVASLPKMADYSASTNYSNIGGASWYVLNNTGNGELAEDFLAKTFASDTDLMNELANEINLVSTLKAAGNAENYSKPSEFFSDQEIFRDFFDWTAEIPAVNYGLYTYTIEDIMTEAVQSILQGADIDETFENTQIQAEAAAIS
ncbi:MAG TPA: ABC transporter substrate-binding protein [Ruminococcus sp.]|nr:ABC transporter substrate-binding protein [Ruminococcus sp.]HCR73300.1 ABC transporter substrate-binding protein [Ruminococcus sp.]